MGESEQQFLSNDSVTNPQSIDEALEKSSKRSSGRPGSFERTFSPSHQKTRNSLVDALILSVDNSEKPPCKFVQSMLL
jgi:hypothetical protein